MPCGGDAFPTKARRPLAIAPTVPRLTPKRAAIWRCESVPSCSRRSISNTVDRASIEGDSRATGSMEQSDWLSVRVTRFFFWSLVFRVDPEIARLGAWLVGIVVGEENVPALVVAG